MVQVKKLASSSTVILALLVLLVAGLFVFGIYNKSSFNSYVTTMGALLSVIGGTFVTHSTNKTNLNETQAQTPDIQAIKSQTNGVIAAQFSAVHQRIDDVLTKLEPLTSAVTSALGVTDPLPPASTTQDAPSQTVDTPPVVTGPPATPVPAVAPEPAASPTPDADTSEPSPVAAPVVATPGPVTEPAKEPEPVKPVTEPKLVTPPAPVGKVNSVLGIDVASYQGEDFSTEGLSFGFSKRSQGTSYLNPWWAAQIEKFRRASMLCGHYLFLEPGSDTNVKEQVDYFLKNLTYKTGEDLILVDWETTGCSEHMRDVALHSLMPHFVHNRVGTYCNLDFWLHVDTESYPGDFLFIADPSAPEGQPRIHYNWKFDQYSSAGGIDHDVSSFTTKAAMLEWAHGK